MPSEPTVPAGHVHLHPEAWQTLRDLYLADPWDFALDICGFDLLVERFHRPLVYFLAGKTQLLIDILNSDLQSEVITQIKKGLKSRGLDWTNQSHFEGIDRSLDYVNARLARGLGKTSCSQAAILHDITVDPNQAWALVSRDDDAAEEMCRFVANIVRSDTYRAMFPDRMPADERVDLTQSSILLSGRTRNLPQPCLTAAGYDSGWTSKHFSRINKDDLVGLENRSAARLKGVHQFLANQTGLEMPGVRFRDVNEGTRWGRNDDAAVLDKDPMCFTIYVPIETYHEPRNYGNMMMAGEPTLPEWADAAKIAERKQKMLANQDEGADAILANLHLTTPEDGDALFPKDFIETAPMYIVEEKNGKESIARLAMTQKKVVIRETDGTPKLFHFDPLTKFQRVLALDPSVAMNGDEWSFTAMGRDPYGVKYQLETTAGHGVPALVAEFKRLARKWNPSRIGFEKGSMEILLNVILNQDEEARFWVPLIEGVPHRNKRKTDRIRANVAAPTQMGDLFWDPRDKASRKEARDYDENNPRAIDNRLDSMAIASSLFDTPAMGVSDAEVLAAAKKDERKYQDSVDRQTGVAYDNWLTDDDEGYFN